MTPALAFRHVSKRFGKKTALDDVSFTLPRGTFLGLVGRNGAGKSTLIKLATTLLAPSAGTISLLGHDLATDGLAARRRIGVMPEDMALLELLSPAQYLRFVGRMHGLATREVDRRGAELFELLELGDAARSPVGDFSYGMKKKLALAAALLHGPDLLFLDEPFEGVDAVGSKVIREVLARMTASGVTVVLTTHVLEVVERLCPMLAILDKGRLKGFGSFDALLGEAPSLEAYFLGLVGGAEPATLSWL